MTNTSIIILAAGKGTRMKSDLPKVLHQINGQSLIKSVLKTAEQLNPQKIIVVVGHQFQQVIDHLQPTQESSNLHFAIQTPQLGTAHAVEQAIPHFVDSDNNILILSGDVPLITAKTLQEMRDSHQTSNKLVTLMTSTIENPTGYGRVIRTSNQEFDQIIEEKDIPTYQNQTQEIIRDTCEINAGIYLINASHLRAILPKIGNQNQQKEYYLTDVVNLTNPDQVNIYHTENLIEIQGVNTIEQLKELEQQKN